uniref:Uncharacterized protein n=1 Tax=Anguilla anguilla TaxID=7936 RepID=A0A0E9UBQ9_ANGAN
MSFFMALGDGLTGAKALQAFWGPHHPQVFLTLVLISVRAERFVVSFGLSRHRQG